MADFALSRLTHDVVQNTYKELHALLDSLGEASRSERRHRMLDFVLSMRHRYARLLAVVRWFMAYSASHGYAKVARELAATRSSVYTRDADSLCMVSGTSRAAASIPSALPEAAEVLGANPFFDRLPRVIEWSIGLDIDHDFDQLNTLQPLSITNKSDDNLTPNTALVDASPQKVNVYDSSSDTPHGDIQGEALTRLHALTRRIVADNLPSGVRIVRETVARDSIPVRICVPGAWTADIVLDSLYEHSTALHLLSLNITVASHPDAPTISRRHDSERPVHFMSAELINLRAMLADRMHWAAAGCEARLENKEHNAKRIECALRTLCDTISGECCAQMAMAQLRNQVTAMIVHRVWRHAGLNVSGRFAESMKNVPLQVSYWPESHLRASVAICIATDKEEGVTDAGKAGWESTARERMVDVRHEPSLPGRLVSVPLHLHSLNFEKFLLECGRVRAAHELTVLATICEQAGGIGCTAKVMSRGQTSSGLMVSFEEAGAALVFAISLVSGGFSVLPHGAVSCALGRDEDVSGDLLKALWDGERHFRGGSAETRDIISNIVRKSKDAVRKVSLMRSAWTAGLCSLTSWPATREAVESGARAAESKVLKAPMLQVERKRPRVFLTMESVGTGPEMTIPGMNLEMGSPAKRQRRNAFGMEHMSTDDLTFYEGKIVKGIVSPLSGVNVACSGWRSAAWAELRYDVEMRIRRETLMEMLLAQQAISSWTCEGCGDRANRIRVQVRSAPLDVEKAVVVMRDDDTWCLRMYLKSDVFEDALFCGFGVSYCANTRELRFSFNSVSKTAVRSCARELMRARTAYTLSSGLSEKNAHYNVVERTHTHVLVQVEEIRLHVGFGLASIEVEAWPRKDILTKELIPMMEEVLTHGRKDMGLALSGMLELSVPMMKALALTMVRKSEFETRVIFSSVLSVRMVGARRMGGSKRILYAVEVDGQDGRGRVVVADGGRKGLKVGKGASGADGVSGSEMSSTSQRSGGGSSSGVRGGASSGGGGGRGELAAIPRWDEIVEALVAKGMTQATVPTAKVEIDVKSLPKMLNALVAVMQGKRPGAES